MGMPAARVGDMHVCPMVTGVVPHVGGPILPPCAPTVLTGKRPQARIGDMCTCVGPPDVIAMGAFTVIVSGMPAARILDMTAHGGMIVLGEFTVLIGDAGGGGGGGGGGSMVKRGTGGSGGAGTGADAQGDGTDMAQTPECARLAKAREDAILANHTYGEDPTLPPGYRKLDPNTPEGLAALRNLGITSPDELAPPGSTFRAEIFAKDTPNGPVHTVAFRGTAESADWLENGKQGVGMESDHYRRAKMIATTVAQNDPNVSFTGHSLGGGLASAAAARTGRPANTFNAAGLSARTVDGYPDPAAPVDAYYVPGEVLSTVQDNRGGVLAGIAGVATAIHPSLGGLVGGWIVGREAGDSPILPQAYGNRHKLPLVAPPGKQIYDGWNPVTGVKHSVDRHGMDWVGAGIQQQQQDAGCI